MENRIYLKVPKESIALLTKLIEGYDNLGVVSTINPQEGLVMVHVTPDTENDILAILQGLSFVESIEAR